MAVRSIAADFGPNGGGCGYCHTEGMARSHGMITYVLSVDDYQCLIDRGWRRSGVICYKPLMAKTCCPAYTIKCDATKFKLSKSQKKILRKFNKYLCNDDTMEQGDSDNEFEETIDAEPSKLTVKSIPKTKTETDDKAQNKSNVNIEMENNECKSPSNSCIKGVGADPNKLPCKKAKKIRQEKREMKLKLKGVDPTKMNNSAKQKEKTLEDFLNDLPESFAKRLQTKLVKADSNEWKEMESIEHDLYKKYQMSVHNDPPTKCSISQFLRFLVKSPLKIKCVQCNSEEFNSTFNISAKLFSKYQVTIHHDKPDEADIDQFRDFLVKSPLKPEVRGSVEYGSFHQQYWLDNQLIAVGVIDILPKCVSSVYFFYDPDYNKLSIGTYGALREIAFTKSLQGMDSNIQYYYMGFYIHSCPKMRYKANFQPSYLLCPETYYWFPLKECISKLDREPYVRLNNDIDAIDVDYFDESKVVNIPIFLDNRVVLFGTFKNTCKNKMVLKKMEKMLILYGTCTGKTCSEKIVMYIQKE